MTALRPGRGHRFRQLRHPGSWDLLFLWSGPGIAAVESALLRNCYLEVRAMGRLHEAMRHIFQLVLGRLLALAQLGRALARDVAEDTQAGAAPVPSGLKGAT